MIWQILVQFVFRLAFGLAAAMSLTSSKEVTAGFFRVHLWVVMGLNTFVAALAWSLPDIVPQAASVRWLATVGAILSYVGAVAWLYEGHRTGRILLVLVTVVNVVGAIVASRGQVPSPAWTPWLVGADTMSSGLLLGTVFSSMLLGHWYLNTPTMKLAPLKRLILLTLVAVLVRAIISGGGLLAVVGMLESLQQAPWAFVSLRWLTGIFGVIAMAVMAWWTLQIPNTQSATGILYVGVIFVFLGELTSQLLSAQTPFPV